MPKLYLGGALTNAPEEFRQQLSWLQDEMERRSWNVLRFLGLGEAQLGQVYRDDIGRVASCDMMVAVCDYDSTGLGMEIQGAVSAGKPLLLCAQESRKVTRMVTHIPPNYPGSTFVTYDEVGAIPDLAQKFWENLTS